MSQPSAPLSSADRDIIEYGRISGWALAAVLFGLLSAAAIIGPILWFIPILAGVISIVAMQRITASDRQLSGWHLALLGLLLAVFFGAAGPVRTLSRQYMLEARATHFTEKFMELLVQNEPLAAFQFTLPAAKRTVVQGGQTEPKDKSADAKKPYDEFLKLEPVKQLLAAGAESKIEPLSTTYIGGDDLRDEVLVRLRIRSPQIGESKSTVVQMYAERTLAYGSHTEQWQILPRTFRIE
ncbi:MAG TPA: hypothetical protein VFE46_09080 [Pirellulales bacterium]|jgi:hypothetical protein|nr:hypothetical protein [Pirellulales bacterium]